MRDRVAMVHVSGFANFRAMNECEVLKRISRSFAQGLQSNAYDFAYTEKKYFTGRSGWEHAGKFAVGGAAGVGADHFFTSAKNNLKPFGRISAGALVYAAEWMITSRIKYGSYARYNGYDPGGFYTGRSQKAKGWVSGFKWALPSYNFIFGR